VPKPERRGLSSAIPHLPSPPPVEVSDEAARRILNFSPDQPASQTDSGPASQHASETASKPDSMRTVQPAIPKVALTTRIPTSLKTKLRRIAQYNDMEIETIIVRALERELDLDVYEKPGKWGREE
jgi:hypothetical protein